MKFSRGKRWFRHNGLTVLLLGLFLLTWVGGQIPAGLGSHNEERAEHGEHPLTLGEYLRSAHFIEATAENWESEFLQMFIFVYASAFLFQKGSAESKDPDAADEEPSPNCAEEKKPWPVRKGGAWLRLYEHSLSLALAALFALSFTGHVIGSVALENEERARLAMPAVRWTDHLASSQFWFESMQNWQSEFLAIGTIVVLTIFLREKDSAQSKPVDAPHGQTGG